MSPIALIHQLSLKIAQAGILPTKSYEVLFKKRPSAIFPDVIFIYDSKTRNYRVGIYPSVNSYEDIMSAMLWAMSQDKDIDTVQSVRPLR